MKSNIKRLIAIDKKYIEAPVYICAKEDPRTKTLVDYEGRLTDAEIENLHVKLDTDTQLRVSHLMTFDLSNPNDKIHFEVIRDDKLIALSKDEVNPGAHRYYIEDKEHEASIAISKTRLKAKAFKVIALLSLEDMINYSRILGKFAKQLSGTQVEALLYEYCEDAPQKIIDISEDRDLKYKILMHKLTSNGFIGIKNGKYWNGSDPIGINEHYVVEWLKDPKNSVIITQWTRQMDGSPSPSIVNSFDEEIEENQLEEKILKKAVKKTTKKAKAN